MDERWVRRNKVKTMEDQGFEIKHVGGKPVTRGGVTKGHNRVEDASVYLMFKPDVPRETEPEKPRIGRPKKEK